MFDSRTYTYVCPRACMAERRKNARTRNKSSLASFYRGTSGITRAHLIRNATALARSPATKLNRLSGVPPRKFQRRASTNPVLDPPRICHIYKRPASINRSGVAFDTRGSSNNRISIFVSDRGPGTRPTKSSLGLSPIEKFKGFERVLASDGVPVT